MQTQYLFDDFDYFKEISSKNKPNLYEFTYNDRKCCFDYNITPYFYHYYIEKWGYDFINRKIRNLRDSKLRNNLNDQVSYCVFYKLHCEDELLTFFQDVDSLNIFYFNKLKGFTPFFNAKETFRTLVDKFFEQRYFNEIISIFLAYYIDNYLQDEVLSYWIDYTRIIRNTFNNETVEERIKSIKDRTNEILTMYSSSYFIPHNVLSITEGISNYSFVKMINHIDEEVEEKKPGQVHIYKQSFVKRYMQYFPLYANFLNQNKDSFVNDGKINIPKNSIQFKLFDFVYNNYYKEECLRFRDYLSMLNLEMFYDDLASYVPVSSVSLEYFIKRNFLVKYSEYGFEMYTALLLVYWLYDMDYMAYSNNRFVGYKLLKFLQESDAKDNNIHYKLMSLSSVTNDIIKKANNFMDTFNLPIIPCIYDVDMKFLENGKFNLPWEYVTFMDRYLVLHHPLHANDSKYVPLKISCIEAKADYNRIKLFFANTVPLIEVISKKGKITNFNKDSLVNFHDYVQNIIYKTSHKRVKIAINHTSHNSGNIHSYDIAEARHLPQVAKSFYLEELCKMHLSYYKVYHFMELRATASSSSSESVFCFVVRASFDRLVLAVENTLDSRSTIIFFVKKELLNRALNVINVFFSSDTLNKRQSIQWHDVNFNDSSIIKYTRVIHTTADEWNYNIRRILNQ